MNTTGTAPSITGPKTGDTRNMLLWAVLLIVSGICAAIIFIVVKRKRFRSKDKN